MNTIKGEAIAAFFLSVGLLTVFAPGAAGELETKLFLGYREILPHFIPIYHAFISS